MKLSLKELAANASRSFFKEKSFSLTGIPWGITSLDDRVSTVIVGEHFVCPPPLTVQKYWHAGFEKSTIPISSIPFQTLKVKGGIATSVGGNLTEEGRLISTFLSPTDGKRVDEHELFHFSLSRLRPHIHKIDEEVISLTAGWQGAFYHWMFQILPRLAAAGEGKIYLDQSHRFQRESIELMGLRERVIDASKIKALQAAELVIPQSPYSPTPKTCQFLRETLLPYVPKLPPARLYLSRGDAKTRRIENESELIPLLEEKGFQTIVLSKYSLADQIALLHSAEMVIAPHGAGLSHLAFCKEGTKVLELFHTKYFNPCYWHLCAAGSLSYHVLFDARDTNDEDPNLIIDPNELKQTLDAWFN